MRFINSIKLYFFIAFLSFFIISCNKKEKWVSKIEYPIEKEVEIEKISPRVNYTKTFDGDNIKNITGIELSLKPTPEFKDSIIIDSNEINFEEGKMRSKINLKLKYYQSKYIEIKNLNSIRLDLCKSSNKLENKTIYINFLTDSSFVNVKNLKNDFLFDIAYATKENFTENQIYECAECLLRWKVAKAILKASQKIENKGYRFLFYDCYRPVDAQIKLWEKVPNPTYVANPYGKGSIHSRGGAVDITIADKDGWPLDMGTDYDYFGKEARHAYVDFEEEVLNNRKLLKETLESVGFRSITSEWWHYNFKGSSKFTQSNTPFLCEKFN